MVDGFIMAMLWAETLSILYVYVPNQQNIQLPQKI